MAIKFEKIGENENNLLQNRELLKDQMITPKSKRIFGLKPESNHEFDQKINKIISTSTAISNYLQDSVLLFLCSFYLFLLFISCYSSFYPFSISS